MKKTKNLSLFFLFHFAFNSLANIGNANFEAGNTSWTIANGSSTNKWFIGTNQKKAGTYGAYIGTSSSTNSYNVNSSSASHLYQDVTFPACSGNAVLKFWVKLNGEKVGNVFYDWLCIRLTPTSVTYNSNIYTSGNVSNCSVPPSNASNPSAFPSYVISETGCGHLNDAAGMYYSKTSWTQITITVPQSLAGYTTGTSSTRRIWFSWFNDDGSGSGTGAAIDDIQLFNSCGAALPITLTSFHAERTDHTVLLNWETASETNNDFFTVERTLDGMHFETVATVKGAGNSSRSLQYQVYDAHPFPEKCYYRLKQTDFDGREQYFDLQPVDAGPSSFLIGDPYPNPSRELLNVDLSTVERCRISLDLTDCSGRIFGSAEETIGPGRTTLTLNTASLPAGIYFLRILLNDSDFISVRKVIRE